MSFIVFKLRFEGHFSALEDDSGIVFYRLQYYMVSGSLPWKFSDFLS